MQRAMAVLAWILMQAVVTAEAQVADHLECYGIKDSAGKASYVADLNGLAVEPGCEITVPAKLICVGTTKTNVQPAPPIDGDGAEQSRVVCYKVKCPKQELPAVAWTDQFGARTLTTKKSKYVCAPDLAPSTPTFHYIFVTSRLFDGNLFGVSGADSKCQAAAIAASLSGTYLAFIGATGLSAASRVGDFEFRLTDGVTVVANDKADLLDGSLDSAIVLDESGASVAASAEVRVWTATRSNGSYVGENCNSSGVVGDWSTTSSRATAGISTSTSGWADGASIQPCASQFRLYCVQQ